MQVNFQILCNFEVIGLVEVNWVLLKNNAIRYLLLQGPAVDYDDLLNQKRRAELQYR